jgi:hypothetical protein
VTTWHLFVLVWGAEFVRRFGAFAVPFHAMPGNIPALAVDNHVVFHVYTDSASVDQVRAAMAPLSSLCQIAIHCFDALTFQGAPLVRPARGLANPEFRFAVQRQCLRHLADYIVNEINDPGAPIVLLDSNFVPADGTLAHLATRRAQGFLAATVSVMRVATGPFTSALAPQLASGGPIGSRPLLLAGLSSLHEMTRAFFVDAEPFTPYPSQLCWPAGPDGFVNRNILPHPLMVPAVRAIQRSQSTMDYDLALRLVADDEIYVCPDSDEMLVVKFSDDTLGNERPIGVSPSDETIGLFLLAATNTRHRLFADTPVAFHSGDLDERYADAVVRSQSVIDGAYRWVERALANPGKLDARLMMHAKSFTGPIEDYMSPQLEPAALRYLT